MDWFIRDVDTLWQGLAACLLILGTVIVTVRVAGLRTFSKMTSFDFAVPVAMGSVLGATATGSVTVAQGTVAVVALVALQAACAKAIRKSNVVGRLLENSPLLIMDGPNVLHGNLEHARMSESELIAKLREANVLDRSQVRAVVLESTGDVSVLHSERETDQVENWILEQVRRTP